MYRQQETCMDTLGWSDAAEFCLRNRGVTGTDSLSMSEDWNSGVCKRSAAKCGEKEIYYG